MSFAGFAQDKSEQTGVSGGEGAQAAETDRSGLRTAVRPAAGLVVTMESKIKEGHEAFIKLASAEVWGADRGDGLGLQTAAQSATGVDLGQDGGHRDAS